MATKSPAKTTHKSKDQAYAPRLKLRYRDEIKAAIAKELSVDNPNAVPKLEKIILNIGLGRGQDDKRLFEVATNTLRKITGQQPVQTKARKSIASFKLREGNPIGLMVTLRGDRMYEFFDRLTALILPRVRDFHGVSRKAFDGSGNYHLGLVEQSVFPELSFEETTVLHGLQISIITTTDSDAAALVLLRELGMPFAKEQE